MTFKKKAWATFVVLSVVGSFTALMRTTLAQEGKEALEREAEIAANGIENPESELF